MCAGGRGKRVGVVRGSHRRKMLDSGQDDVLPGRIELDMLRYRSFTLPRIL